MYSKRAGKLPLFILRNNNLGKNKEDINE